MRLAAPGCGHGLIEEVSHPVGRECAPPRVLRRQGAEPYARRWDREVERRPHSEHVDADPHERVGEQGEPGIFAGERATEHTCEAVSYQPGQCNRGPPELIPLNLEHHEHQEDDDDGGSEDPDLPVLPLIHDRQVRNRHDVRAYQGNQLQLDAENQPGYPGLADDLGCRPGYQVDETQADIREVDEALHGVG